MKRIKFVVYASTGGIIFIVSMVRNRNLPIVKRIKLSGKQSLRAIAVGIGLRFGKGRWQDVVDIDNGFITNKTPTVCTKYSTQNSNQCLSIKRSRLIASDDELEALGFAKSEDNSKEVTLVKDFLESKEYNLILLIPITES